MVFALLRVRFAPSPTGFLHLGNARTAILNWLFAKARQAEFWLRLDDTDTARSQEIYTQALFEDLAWLGLSYDHFFKQSERLTRYAEVIEGLKASGRLYPAYETPEELEAIRKAQLKSGRPPIYRKRENSPPPGRKPHWRFRLQEETVSWMDLMRGEIRIPTSSLSDPILVREDGSVVYTLASVVDDYDKGITHVLRGEDHITNTAVQIQLFQALGPAPLPHFGHFPLVLDAQGQGFSKRLGSLSLQDFRRQGMLPQAIISVLTALGTNHAPRVDHALSAYWTHFSLDDYGKASPRLCLDDLWRTQHALLATLPAEVAYAQGLSRNVPPALWEALKQNVQNFEEVYPWQATLENPLSTEALDPAFAKEALACLPPEPWDAGTWGLWTSALSQRTGIKGKALYQPLRRALTGRDHGPEMKALLPLIPRAVACKKLETAG